MTHQAIGKELVEQLTKGKRTVTLEHQGTRITVETSDSDRLGVLLHSIRIERVAAKAAKMDADTLRARLRSLGERMDYLPERLTLVEHDPARTGALMRSSAPRQVGPHREYFEFRVEKNLESAFHRFRQPPGGADRTTVPTLLPRSTLARLVDDLQAAVRA